MTDDMVLKDVNGTSHPITKNNISWMLGIGWIFYLASFILNIIYYMIHPSFADISGPGLLRRLTCGEEEGLGDEGQVDTEENIDMERKEQTDIENVEEEIPLMHVE